LWTFIAPKFPAERRSAAARRKAGTKQPQGFDEIGNYFVRRSIGRSLDTAGLEENAQANPRCGTGFDILHTVAQDGRSREI
jgi:hypothetical protein